MCEPILLSTLVGSATGGAGFLGLLGGSAAGGLGITGFGAAMSGAQALSLGLAAGGATMAASSAYTQSKAAQQVANNNATIAGYQAEDAQRRGEQDAQKAQREGRQLVGAQRAAFSARGIDISEGTAADVLDQTDFFAKADAATARDNAAKEGWAHRARQSGFEGEARSQNPMLASFGSLLTGAGTVADKWYRFTKG